MRGPRGRIYTYALLDGGSTTNVITRDMGRKIGLKTVKQFMRITVLGNTTEEETEVTSASISGINGFDLELDTAIYGEILSSSHEEVPTFSDIEGLDHCRGVVFEEFPAGVEVDERIGVIIGTKHARTWKGVECRIGPEEQPIAVETKFGWALMGPKSSPSSSPSSQTCFHKISALPTPRRDGIDSELSDLLAKHFEPVDEGKTDYSVEDKFAIKQLEDTVVWDPVARRWRVGLPWVNGREDAAKHLNALNSERMSLDRLRRSAFKMNKDPTRKEVIFKQMQEFDDNGQVVDVDPEEHRNMPPDRPKWVVPLHIVDKPGKPGQVRVCHD